MICVLYIDDDEGLARLMQKALASHAITVDHASGGQESLSKLEARSYDAIALDHNLGTETGLDLIPRLTDASGGTPIIYVTGSDDANIVMSALRSGASDYVWKDLNGHYRELIVAAINDAVAKRKLVAEREEAQKVIVAAKERAEMLLAEVNHRVANSLAMIASLATLQSNVVKDEAAKAALTEMRARIIAIAGIHRRLYTSSDVRYVDLDAYLKNLGTDLLAAVGEGRQTHALNVLADTGIAITTDRAVSLAMIVTELVTNALKYAYPAGQTGEIRLRLRRIGETIAEICVEDDGVGWSGGSGAQGTGLGTRIILVMAKSLNADLAYDVREKGTCVRLSFQIGQT
jgi:two-component sensor histidine kinase